MKSVLFAIVAATALVACGKKEEVKPVEAAPAPAVAPTAPASAPATEPAKQEEAKK
jgi:hypothetical protein